MNAPHFSFDPNRLPSVPVDGSRAPVREQRDLAVRTEDPYGIEEPVSDYRRLFFTYLGLALKYRWLLLAASLVSLVIGFVVTFAETPIYRATTVIQINREAPKVVKVEDASQTHNVGDELRFYQTQYDLLKSRSLAERVAADLNLAIAGDFLRPPSTSAWGHLWRMVFPARKAAVGDLGPRKAAAAAIVQFGLSVAPVPNSSLVQISFESPSPKWAQRVADGVADSYISENLQRRYGATKYARDFIKERLEELKLKLEESEKALVDYADQKEIIEADGKQSLADSDLAALNAALQKATTERIQAEQLWEQANSTREISLPQILNDSSVQALRAKRATLQADYYEKLSTFKPAYPDMVKLKAQIDQISREINSTADVIKQSLKARYDSALQQEALLKTKIGEVKRGVLDTRNKEIQYNILKREADTNRTLYNGLLQQYKDIGVAGAVDTNNVAIIDRAQLPGTPFKPSLNKNLLISLMLGLIFAAAAIAVLEILDDTFKSPEQVEEQLGLAVLGIIPYAEGDVLVDITGSPNSPLAEAYRSFRTALQFSTDQGAPKSLVVTSARPGEGKSTTALALAVNFAQLGMKVLLIDADLRNPSLHRNLKRENSAGLANYLAGAVMPGSIFQESGIDGLYVMTSGPLPPNPAELLAGPKMLSLLSAASEKFDTVIVDSPPVMGIADAPLLASIASGTLLVMAAGDTRRGVVKAALKRLHFARARIVGAVMNKFDFQAASYGYGYGSGYGYGYGYGYGALEHYGYGQNTPAQVEHTSEA